jgi:hypothetical protein
LIRVSSVFMGVHSSVCGARQGAGEAARALSVTSW